MTITVSQHVPGFVETDTRHRAVVHSLDELLALDWIARWAVSWPAHDARYDVTSWSNGMATHTTETRHTPASTFFRWSLSEGDLMAEFNNGDVFYVVAHLRSDEPMPLPEWQETDNARLRREAWNRGETG